MSAVSEAYCATGREIALCATSLLPRFSVFYDAAPGIPALRGIRPSMAKKNRPFYGAAENERLPARVSTTIGNEN